MAHFSSSAATRPSVESIDLLLDERDAKDSLCAQTVVRAAVKSEKSLVVTAIQSKGPLVLNLESGPRATSGPVLRSVFALMTSSLVDALADCRGDVAGLRENLVWTRFCSGSFGALRFTFKPPLTLSLDVLLLERHIQGLLHDLSHALVGVFDTENFQPGARTSP